MIRPEFIERVKTERIAVHCRTEQEVEEWCAFLTEHLSDRYHAYSSSTDHMVNGYIANEHHFDNVYEWSREFSWYKNRGYTMLSFTDVSSLIKNFNNLKEL